MFCFIYLPLALDRSHLSRKYRPHLTESWTRSSWRSAASSRRGCNLLACPSHHPLFLKLHLQNQDIGQNNFFNNGMSIPPESRSLPLIASEFPLKSDQMTQSTRKRAQLGMWRAHTDSLTWTKPHSHSYPHASTPPRFLCHWLDSPISATLIHNPTPLSPLLHQLPNLALALPTSTPCTLFQIHGPRHHNHQYSQECKNHPNNMESRNAETRDTNWLDHRLPHGPLRYGWSTAGSVHSPPSLVRTREQKPRFEWRSGVDKGKCKDGITCSTSFLVTLLVAA